MKNIDLHKLNNAYPYVVLFLFISPGIAWIILDQQVWPRDQAWYGQVSVELFYALLNSHPTGFPNAQCFR